MFNVGKHGPAVPLKTHVAAPGPTNTERLKTTSARDGFVSMCACMEPVGLALVAGALSAFDRSARLRC